MVSSPCMPSFKPILQSNRYMSPEQFRGDFLTSKSDCFSFGSLVWQLFTGKAPWDGLQGHTVSMKVHVRMQSAKAIMKCELL